MKGMEYESSLNVDTIRLSLASQRIIEGVDLSKLPSVPSVYLGSTTMADVPFRDVPQSLIDEVDKICRPQVGMNPVMAGTSPAGLYETVRQRIREETKAGQKHDAGKLRWHLLPWPQIAVVAEVMEHGAKKYGERNWMEVNNGYERYFDAAMRHITAEESGEALDPESGLPHLAHAVCCLLFMMHFEGP